MIAIIDYNLGNLKSILNAAKRIKMDVVVTREPAVIRDAKGIILPGVGTFSVAMGNLNKFNLIEILQERRNLGVPILGICLGMQILFEKGYEVKETGGLGFLSGEVNLIKTDEKIPHMGWNQLHFCKPNHPILKNISEFSDVYFVHSYMAEAKEDELIAYAEYGDTKITALVGKGNIVGCQFHPEKSGEIGAKILLAWKEMFGC